MYLLRLLVWKLEIKVLLYLPVSQPPTVTMVLVSIKKKILVLSVCAVLLYYEAMSHTQRSMFMHDVIIGKSLQLGRTDRNNARLTKLNFDKSEIQWLHSARQRRLNHAECNVKLPDLNFLLAPNSGTSTCKSLKNEAVRPQTYV